MSGSASMVCVFPLTLRSMRLATSISPWLDSKEDHALGRTLPQGRMAAAVPSSRPYDARVCRFGRFPMATSITRRNLLNTASAAVIGGVTTAQAQTPGAPGEYLIRNAHVLSMDPAIGDLPRGDIHVRAGAIVAVGAGLNAPGAELIDGRTLIACPGFVETHWHMWGAVARNMAGEEEKTGYFPFSRVLGVQFTPEDNARGVRLALAEAIASGITTVHNWSHNLLSPAYADAELAVHREVGLRARFAYGYSRNTGPNETLPLDDAARVQRQYFGGGSGLLTLGIAPRGIESNTVDICQKEWEFARKLGIGITTHAGTSPKRTDSVKRMS